MITEEKCDLLILDCCFYVNFHSSEFILHERQSQC